MLVAVLDGRMKSGLCPSETVLAGFMGFIHLIYKSVSLCYTTSKPPENLCRTGFYITETEFIVDREKRLKVVMVKDSFWIILLLHLA